MEVNSCCRLLCLSVIVLALATGTNAFSWRLDAMRPPNDRLMVSPEEAHDYDDMVPDMASLSYMFPDEAAAGKLNVTYACNADDSLADVSKGGNFTHKECFGTFTAFWSNHTERACMFGGVKCEGHWTFIKAPCGAKVMVCEGLFHHIDKVAFKPEAGSNAPVVKVFKGVGALGTSGAVIAPPPKDDDDDDDDDDDKRVKHGKGMKEGKHGHKEGGEKHKEGREKRKAFFASLPGAELWADDFMPESKKALKAEDQKTVASWRTTGVKGQITIIKKEESAWNGQAKSGNGGKWRSGMTYDKLEAKWNATIAEFGMPLIPNPSFAIGFPSTWGPPPAPKGTSGPPQFTTTCNGKPAWWGGKFPCWGSFEMEVEFEHPGVHGGKSFTVEIEAKCKGFWSGFLGHRCTGFSSSVKEWKEYEKYGQCSGRFGVGFRPLPTGVAMGNFCKGKSIGAFLVDDDDDDDARHAVTLTKAPVTLTKAAGSTVVAALQAAETIA